MRLSRLTWWGRTLTCTQTPRGDHRLWIPDTYCQCWLRSQRPARPTEGTRRRRDREPSQPQGSSQMPLSEQRSRGDASRVVPRLGCSVQEPLASRLNAPNIRPGAVRVIS